MNAINRPAALQGNTISHRSLKNRVWQLPEISEGEVIKLVANGANALTAPILAARGMDAEDIAHFLAPTIKELLPNPNFFLDMDAGADRIAEAIIQGEKIAIWSDYDVDGATSAATMGRFLQDCGLEFDLYIPDRIEEGYGPNAKGLLSLQAMGNNGRQYALANHTYDVLARSFLDAIKRVSSRL